MKFVLVLYALIGAVTALPIPPRDGFMMSANDVGYMGFGFNGFGKDGLAYPDLFNSWLHNGTWVTHWQEMR
jgi:hypothetical protein